MLLLAAVPVSRSALCLFQLRQLPVDLLVPAALEGQINRDNANHIRAVTSGFVIGTARPYHLGRRSHVWEIRIVDERDKLVCISRLTMAVIDK